MLYYLNTGHFPSVATLPKSYPKVSVGVTWFNDSPEIENLLSTVFWLIDDGSEFVHGTVIPIDGEFSAFSGV